MNINISNTNLTRWFVCTTSLRLISIVVLILVTLGTDKVQAEPVCSNTPAAGDRVYCEELLTGNINIDLDGVMIDTLEAGEKSVEAALIDTGKITINVQNSSSTTEKGHSDNISAEHFGTGDIDIDVRGFTSATKGGLSNGILGWHIGTGNIDIDVWDFTSTTEGDDSCGIVGRFTLSGQSSGDIDIDVHNTSITTKGSRAHGILGFYRDAGPEQDNLNIYVQGSMLATEGGSAYGVYGIHQGNGNVDIYVEDSTITSEMAESSGIVGRHAHNTHSDDIDIDVHRTSITTKGGMSHGIHGWHEAPVLGQDPGQDNLNINVQGSRSLKTEGDAAYGVYGLHQGNGVVDINVGDSAITTMGEGSHGIVSLHQGTDETETDINVRGSTITTMGEGSHGIVSLHQGTDETETDINVRGSTITTMGETAHGIYGWKFSTATGDIDIDVQNGTRIITEGVDSYGVYGRHQGNGNVKVVNSGDVTAMGSRSVGLRVGISRAGNAEVEMTDGSSVTAGTNGTKFGIGIEAMANTDTTFSDYGDDVDVKIDVMGSEITAYSANLDDPTTTDYDESSGIGIFANAGTDANGRIVTHINRSTITADTAMKFVNGRTMLELEYSTVTGDIEFDEDGDTAVATSDINLIESKNINDRMTVRHSTITGDVNFGLGNDLLEVIGSVFDGNLNMGEGDDTITVDLHGGKFTGEIDFGENSNDYDRLMLDVAASSTLLFEGEILNLEYLNKRNSGTAIVGNITFSGSTVDIEEGQLLVTGHLDVGDGDITIYDQGLLAFEVGDIVTDASDHGRITARGGIKFMEDTKPVVDVQIRHDLTETQADDVREKLNTNGIDVLELQTNFMDSGGNLITELCVTSNGETTENMMNSGTTVFADAEAIAQNEEPIFEVASPPSSTRRGEAPLSTRRGEAPSSTRRGGGDGGGSSSNGLIIGASLIAFLLSNWMDGGFDTFADDEEENLGLSNINVSSATSFLPGIGEERRFQIGNIEHRIRSYAGQSLASVVGAQTKTSGTAYGINTKLRNGFDLGVSFMPRLMSSTQGLDSNFYSSSFDGELYEVQFGWQSNQFFSKLQLSHGDYDVDSVVANPVVNSALRGVYNMTNTHAQFTGGAKLEFGGVRVAPSVSLFGGSLEQTSHSAEGPVMRADVPEISQRYSGWKLGMKLTSSTWLKDSGNLSWRPSLHFSTMQTNTSGPSSLSVMQADRVGALSFTNQAGVRGMPRVAHALGVNTIIKQSKNSRFNVGYIGTEVDGERGHAVLARYQLRF